MEMSSGRWGKVGIVQKTNIHYIEAEYKSELMKLHHRFNHLNLSSP